VIELSLLGPVGVSVDGEAPPPELLWDKNLGLLVYLACSPKRSRTREHLAGLLWPDKIQKKAKGSLREALSKVRAVVGEAGIDTEGDQVRLAAGVVALDTDRFLALCSAGDWEGAAQLVCGPFLEGFAIEGAGEFEEWLSAVRREWSARSVNALLQLAQAKLDGGDLEAAAAVARRTLAIAPECEAAVLTLMRVHALEGNPALALREYEGFATRLRTELGTSPSPACAALAERIRAAPDAGDGREPRAAANPRRVSLVGRGDQLERLLDAWRRCRDGPRAAAVVLIGDPGVGKTRLADELSQRLRLEGVATAVLRAVESDLGTPWNGVLGLARGGLLEARGIAGAAPGALAWFAVRIAEWADRYPATRRAQEEPAPARALGEVLSAASAVQPVALVLDDADYVDRDSLLAVRAVLRDLAQRPIFVVYAASGVPERAELDELRAQVGRDVDGTVVRLAPLATAEIAQLARRALPDYPPANFDRLIRRISTDSAGLPLLVVEILSAVAAGMDLEKLRGAWPEPMRTLDQSLPVDLPESVIGATRVNFRRLSAAAQRALQATSVLEELVPAARLARATGLSAEAVAEALDELERSRWLVADSRGYAFVARIIREVVKQDLVLPGQARRFRDAAGPR
jgi:DNA-binding SARP family transcriptional activator